MFFRVTDVAQPNNVKRVAVAVVMVAGQLAPFTLFAALLAATRLRQLPRPYGVTHLLMRRLHYRVTVISLCPNLVRVAANALSLAMPTVRPQPDRLIAALMKFGLVSELSAF